MYDYDSLLGLYSSQNFLNQKIIEKFNSKYVEVKIVKNLLSSDLSKFNYLVINLLSSSYDKNEIIDAVSKIKCKIVVLVPFKVHKKYFEEFDNFLEKLIKSNKNLGIILTPEVLGETVKYQEDNISHNLIMQSVLSERVKISNLQKKLNLVSINKLVDEVVRETFSFGISGKKILLVGFNKSSKYFAEKLLGKAEINIISKFEPDEYQEVMPDVKKEISFPIHSVVSKTLKSFTSQKIVAPEENILNPTIVAKRNRKPSVYKKILRVGFVILLISLVVCIIPLVLTLVSLGGLFLAGRIVSQNQDVAFGLIKFSRSMSSLSNNLNLKIPFYVDAGNLTYKATSIATQFISLAESGKNLSTKILGESSYPLESYSNDISANLDRIYTDISFIQSDIAEIPGLIGKKIRFDLDLHKISIEKIKGNIYNLKKFTSRLSEILGVNSPKKYLVLFQNNMELRPTGGFIGSFALVTFDQGRMSEIVVNDVYSADGQLKGHVDPPAPILKYLNEGGWYLRDSNWDPDFPLTAEKIEWFLDKEIDQKVDGVISVDLNFVKSLISIVGSIHLPDFNTTITDKNLYQTTQSEVEDEFFPGSIKKASFLTSLTRNLITELRNLKEDKYVLLFKEIYTNLQERHIQVNLHDLNAQEAISGMGYSGSVDMQTNCGLRCISDRYLVVDANVGVNKSNFFIKRSQDLNLVVNKRNINHELFVTYENNAGPSIGQSGIYKNYARLIVPKQATIHGVRLYKLNGSYEDITYDLVDTPKRREIGFYFEVMPSTAARIQIVWRLEPSNLNEGGEYRLLVKKQSGTDNDILNIQINSDDLSLTGKVDSVYNTDLRTDFETKLFFGL